MEQFRLTIHTAGPTADLAERLLGIGNAVSVTEADLYWDTGIGVQSQRVARVEIILGRDWVPPALLAVEDWLSETDLTEILIEIQTTFARSLRRGD